MLPLQRSKFTLPGGSIYLNCAYMSPLLKKVERAGIAGLMRKRNPLSISPQDFFTETELLRKEFAKLVNTNDDGRIVVVPSVSYGIASVVRNLKLSASDSIVVATEQFPSNYYPWQRLSLETGAKIKCVPAPATTERRGAKWNNRILEAIDRTTEVVALGNVHWADGTLFDLGEIRKRTKDVGALLVVDGTQSVGALPFDIQKIKPDALVCGGYKWLMGPYSIGLAYYGEYFDHGVPIEENWINRLHSEDFTGLVNYESNYQPGALRYEVGEHSNFILVPMMREALKQINQWKPERIQEYCKKISSGAINDLRQAGYWVEDEDSRGAHLFGIRLPEGKSIDDLKKKVSQKKISVSFRGNCIRVSPHVYNSEEEMSRLAKALM
jgi:selenocysteine lyase/cysteine desulfurase